VTPLDLGNVGPLDLLVDSTNKTPAMGMQELSYPAADWQLNVRYTLFLEFNYLTAKNLLLFV
jgi:hypothetical protein